MNPLHTQAFIEIRQFDSDLQACLKETRLTSLVAFRALRRELQRIQELRWAKAHKA